MQYRLPEDDERCKDAPESVYQFASGYCNSIVLKTLAWAAWFQDAVETVNTMTVGVGTVGVAEMRGHNKVRLTSA